MNIDLHSHSYFSDGILSPTELVARAAEKGVTMLALTDHDTVEGLPEAIEAGHQYSVRLIPGVEISCSWNAQTIHIVGLNVDINNRQLQQGLSELKNRRAKRAQGIIEKLSKFGIPGIREGIYSKAKGVVGRVHFAQLLIDKGYAKTVAKAFKQFLARGKVGFVKTEWLTLGQAIDMIHAAGGLAVIAHPRRYKITYKRLEDLVSEFAVLGGDAIEVATSNQRRDDQQLVASLARKYELMVSVGSDFHFPCAYNDLGKPSLSISDLKCVSDVF